MVTTDSKDNYKYQLISLPYFDSTRLKYRKGTSHEEILTFLEKPNSPQKLRFPLEPKPRFCLYIDVKLALLQVAGIVVKYLKDVLNRKNNADFFGNKLQRE